jgi:hypothetical protein
LQPMPIFPPRTEEEPEVGVSTSPAWSPRRMVAVSFAYPARAATPSALVLSSHNKPSRKAQESCYDERFVRQAYPRHPRAHTGL